MFMAARGTTGQIIVCTGRIVKRQRKRELTSCTVRVEYFTTKKSPHLKLSTS